MQRQQEEHQRQVMELQAKHRREMADKEAEHQKEVSFLKSIIQKAKKWFPLFQELVYMEKFCLKVGFNERQTATLISGKPLFYEGELYSEEHRRLASGSRSNSTGCSRPFGEQSHRPIKAKESGCKSDKQEGSKFVFWPAQNLLLSSRWLKHHFICALILLKLACVIPK